MRQDRPARGPRSPTLLGLGTSAGELLGPVLPSPGRSHHQPSTGATGRRGSTGARNGSRDPQERAAAQPGAARSPAPGHQPPYRATNGAERHTAPHTRPQRERSGRRQQGHRRAIAAAPRRTAGPAATSAPRRRQRATAGPSPKHDLSPPRPGRSPTGPISSPRLHSSQPSHSSHHSQKRTRPPEHQGTRPPN